MQLISSKAPLVVAVVVLFFFLGLAAPHAAAAQPERDESVRAQLRSSNYVDTNDTFISTNLVSMRGRPTDELSIGARYLADIITTASIDVVSAATGRWEEIRHETAGSVGFDDGSFRASASYVHSIENDWESHNGDVGVSQDFLGHDLTLGAGGTFSYNTIWRRDDDNFREKLIVVGWAATATWVPGPDDIFQLSYTGSYNDGFQSSPYRHARFLNDDGSLLRGWETHPTLRIRHAATLRYNHATSPMDALRTDVRAYLDDWGVPSVTAGLEYVSTIDVVEVAAHARGYAQHHATFYQDIYDERRVYMTADKELSSFVDVFVGGRVTVRPQIDGLADFFIEARLVGFGFWYLDFGRLPERYGLVGELAVGGAI